MADFEGNTVKELQDLADARGLATSGTKAELIARIEKFDAAAPTEPEPFVAGLNDLVTDGTRLGIVVDLGRTPDPSKGESAEPHIAWLPAASGYGGELNPVT